MRWSKERDSTEWSIVAEKVDIDEGDPAVNLGSG